jgi:hypothetical protein
VTLNDPPDVVAAVSTLQIRLNDTSSGSGGVAENRRRKNSRGRTRSYDKTGGHSKGSDKQEQRAQRCLPQGLTE